MRPHITPLPKTGLTARADWTICIVWLNRKMANTTTMKAATTRAIVFAVLGIAALRSIVSTISPVLQQSLPKAHLLLVTQRARLKKSLSHLFPSLLWAVPRRTPDGLSCATDRNVGFIHGTRPLLATGSSARRL